MREAWRQQEAHRSSQLAKLFPRDYSTRLPQIGCYWFGASVAVAEGIVLVGSALGMVAQWFIDQHEARKRRQLWPHRVA